MKFLIVLLFSLSAYAVPICPKLDAEGFCFVPIDDVFPTQFTIGYQNVLGKRKKIEKIYKKKGDAGIMDFLHRKPTEFIYGPGDKIYIIDRHHTSRAIYNAEVPPQLKYIRGKIKADLRHMSDSDFWNEMKANKWTYLKDEQFRIRFANKLPAQVSQLVDNPYRSMATMLIDEGAIIKVGIPFEEFYYAEFFYNNRLRISGGDKESLKAALPKFVEFMKTPKAIRFTNKIRSTCEAYFTPMKAE